MSHDARILDQFSKQANPFADQPAHSQESSLQQLLAALELAPAHRVLDVACGPALLATRLARHVHEVVGSDITPAMLERAGRERDKAKLTNLRFDLADARALPYADASFDRVVTRYTFHHFERPAEQLREMVRVCKPGGLVAVIDAVPEPDKRDAYDRGELLRDPSHARACTFDELAKLMREAGLQQRRVERYQLTVDFEQQLAASFPNPGDGERLRALFRADADSGRDTMSTHARYQDGALLFSYPCVIFVASKP